MQQILNHYPQLESVTIDEQPLNGKEDFTSGFKTFRIGCGKSICIREADKPDINKDKPADIGSVYTRLITRSCAACREHNGYLYLIWGQNIEENLSHYELYRGETIDFVSCEDTSLANVEPGKYRVTLYEDTNLKEHTRYYYCVRAVNKNNIRGDLSDVFSGVTREFS